MFSFFKKDKAPEPVSAVPETDSAPLVVAGAAELRPDPVPALPGPPPDFDVSALVAPATPGSASTFAPVELDADATLELKPKIVQTIATVFDPEIPVNIFELGLVYDIRVGADRRVWIDMTLTSPNCPSAQSLPHEVQYKTKAVTGVTDAHVEIVWEPPWSMEKMSDAARLELGLL